MKDKFLDNLFSNIFSLLIGVFITVLGFFLTSSATTPEEVKAELMKEIKSQIQPRYQGEKLTITARKYFTKELDISSERSVFVFGDAESKSNHYRWIAIFDNKSPSLIDKLVGRSSSLALSSMSTFEAPFEGTMLFKKVEAIDIDNDGVSEVHVRIKSHYADSTATGGLLFSKNLIGEWNLLGIPSTTMTVSNLLAPKNKALSPITHFGLSHGDNGGLKPIKPIKPSKMNKMSLYEHEWIVDHNGKDTSFTTFRNGGDYKFGSHSVKGHTQIEVLSFFADGNAVLGPHYAIVNTYRITKEAIIPDKLWNWGYPMYSSKPMRINEIEMPSILKAGIIAHTSGDTFFGQTDFEKVKLER